MATQIQKYTKKDGSTAYMFKKYLGIDPITGKRKDTTRRGFKTLKEAKVALSRIEVETAEGVHNVRSSNRTFKEVFEEWFELVYKKKVKESTFWNTRLLFDKHVLPNIGERMIKKITIKDCQILANSWATSSPKRFHRHINYVGMVFKYAVSIEEIKSNPIEKISMPHVQEETPKEGDHNFYDRANLLNFLEQMGKKYPMKRYMFFSLLAYTGMRKGEALALTWRDIDLKKNTLNINKTQAIGKGGALLIQTPKTQASRRIISLDAGTVELLKEWRQLQQKELQQLGFMPAVDQLVFSTTEHNTMLLPRTPQAWLDSFYNKHKAMPRITAHGFRHTHASLLFEAGASMKQVQTRLGHSTIKTTMNVYTHVTQEGKEETALIFGDFMKHGKNLGQTLGQTKKPTR